MPYHIMHTSFPQTVQNLEYVLYMGKNIFDIIKKLPGGAAKNFKINKSYLKYCNIKVIAWITLCKLLYPQI